jgi:hypothetical protein
VALKQPKKLAAAAATDIKRASPISTIANGAVNLRNAIFRIFVVFMPPPGNAIILLPNVVISLCVKMPPSDLNLESLM